MRSSVVRAARRQSLMPGRAANGVAGTLRAGANIALCLAAFLFACLAAAAHAQDGSKAVPALVYGAQTRAGTDTPRPIFAPASAGAVSHLLNNRRSFDESY